MGWVWVLQVLTLRSVCSALVEGSFIWHVGADAFGGNKYVACGYKSLQEILVYWELGCLHGSTVAQTLNAAVKQVAFMPSFAV